MSDIALMLLLGAAVIVVVIAMYTATVTVRNGSCVPVVDSACGIFVKDCMSVERRWVPWLNHFQEWLKTRNRGEPLTESMTRLFQEYRNHCVRFELGQDPFEMANAFESTVVNQDIFGDSRMIVIDCQYFAGLIAKWIERERG